VLAILVLFLISQIPFWKRSFSRAVLSKSREPNGRAVGSALALPTRETQMYMF
jgi:hypothetical protein